MILLRTTAQLHERGPHYVCSLCGGSYSHASGAQPEVSQEIRHETAAEIRREADSALKLLAAQHRQKELDDVWLASLPRWRRILVRVARGLR